MVSSGLECEKWIDVKPQIIICTVGQYAISSTLGHEERRRKKYLRSKAEILPGVEEFIEHPPFR